MSGSGWRQPGWFYHADEDEMVKTPEQLVDLYYKSVGRNGTLLLNLPPDRRGLIHEIDVASLKAFSEILKQTFDTNLAQNCRITASNTRSGFSAFQTKNLLDQDVDSYWACDDSLRSAFIELESSTPFYFDRIMLQEPIRLGQRISSFSVEVEENGSWVEVVSGTTIGYKRLLRINPVKTQKIRIHILEANNTITLSEVGLYLASEREETEPISSGVMGQ